MVEAGGGGEGEAPCSWFVARRDISAFAGVQLGVCT